MNYCEENNFLPKIPINLLNSLEDIEKFKNCYPNKNYQDTYASYEVPDKLNLFLKKYFNFSFNARYQVIKKRLPIHTDYVIEKFNYIIEPGGEKVITRWWDSEKNIIQECLMKTNKWYKLKVNIPHDITEIYSPRISIQIYEFRKS
jgi:hypothetical protein